MESSYEDEAIVEIILASLTAVCFGLWVNSIAAGFFALFVAIWIERWVNS